MTGNRPQTSQLTKRRKFLLIVLLISLPFLAMICLEIIGRLYLHLTYGVPGKSYGIYEGHSELGYIFSKNSYNRTKQYNNEGFQNLDDMVDPAPPGALRIINYGGSTSYCFNLTTEQSWPYKLQKELRRTGHGDTIVLNAGEILWSLGHAYVRAQKDIPELRPDYVIVYSGINEENNWILLHEQGIELEALVKEKQFGAVFNKVLAPSNPIYRNSIVVKGFKWWIEPKLRNILVTKRVKSDPYWEYNYSDSLERKDFIVENYLWLIDKFMQLLDRHRVKMVFIIQANDGKSRRIDRMTSYSHLGAARVAALGGTVIDARELVNEWQGEPLFIDTGIHLTATGTTEFARFLSTRIDWYADHEK